MFDEYNQEHCVPGSDAPTHVVATCPNLSMKMVGVRGFEPPAPASRKQCSTRLSYTPPTGRDI
jgi:hypothetical protein